MYSIRDQGYPPTPTGWGQFAQRRADLPESLTLDAVGAEVLRARAKFPGNRNMLSRGEAPPAPQGTATASPTTSSAPLPLAPAGHVSIPRAALSRLVDATARDASVRDAREAAEHVLHLDLLRHEPARHDAEAARAAARANDPRPCPECHMSVAHKLGCSRRRGGQS